MEFTLRNVALITGAGRGLGRALAEVFSLGGYYLLLSTRSTIIPNQLGTSVVYGDITDEAVLGALTDRALDMGVRVLINNAGRYYRERIDRTPEAEMRGVIELNTIVPMILTKRLWPSLKRGGGVVVNINSLAGKAGGVGELAYCASKHGLRGFSRALQFDATRDGVRVLDVFLGGMRTGMAEGRVGVDKFITPTDAANTIFGIATSDYPSMRAVEIELARRVY